MTRHLPLPRALMALGMAAALGCQPEPDPAPDPVGPPAGPTQLSLWLDGAIGDYLSANVDGTVVGQLTGSFQSTPLCGQVGTLTFTTSAGPHTVAGTGGGLTWSPTVVTANAGQCTLFRFNVPASAATRLTFWLSGSVGAPVNLVIDGLSAGQLTGFFSSAPACGAAGALTVSATPGTHTITASGGGRTWGPAQATAVAGQCRPVQLTVTGGVGGDGTGGTPTFSTPNTEFMQTSADVLPQQCAWTTSAFALSRTATLVFRFAAQYNAQAAIIPATQLANFRGCLAYQGYGIFSSQFGTQPVTLAAGTYYIAVRNAQSLPNKYSFEVDYDIAEMLVNPESGKSFTRTGNPTYAENVTKGARYTRTFTVQNGYRYFLDGTSTGDLECFIIPSTAVSAFMAGQSFTQYSQYQQSGAPCPGLFELKLPAGTYALAVRNNSSSADASLTFSLEEWRVQ